MLNFEEKSTLIQDINNKSQAEIVSHFKIEEEAYLAHYRSKDQAYLMLHQEFVERVSILTRVIKSMQDLSAETVKDNNELATSYQDQVQSLRRTCIELESNYNELEGVIKDRDDTIFHLHKEADNMTSDLRLYQGEPEALASLEIQTLTEFEQKVVKCLQSVSKVKSKVTALAYSIELNRLSRS